MKTGVIKKVWLPVICCVALSLAFFHAPARGDGFEITIEIAPSTLNLQNQGVVVTVHTDIDYGNVDVSSVYLNGILINSWKADNRGNFVAKFLMDDVKLLDGLIIDDYNILKIVGLTRDNEPFWGEEDIRVVDNVPQGRQ